MQIANAWDAQTFVALWVAQTAPDGPYPYLNAARHIRFAAKGLAKALTIMDSNPGRYTFSQREDIREAIAVLRHGFHPYTEPVLEPQQDSDTPVT